MKRERRRCVLKTAPKFEEPVDSKYVWLNNAVFIGKPVEKMGYISTQAWKVLCTLLESANNS